MKLSPVGLALIESSEGCAKLIGNLYFPYPDSKGLPTIGVGHLIKPGEDFSAGLTHDQCLSLLLIDVAWAETRVNDVIREVPGWSNLNQNQFDALVDFTFNEGSGNLNKIVIAAGVPGNIPDHLLLYDEAGGKVMPGLLARRKKELELWRTV